MGSGKKEFKHKEKIAEPTPVVEVKKEPVKVSDLIGELDSLANTLKARFYNEEMVQVIEVAVRDVIKSLSEAQKIKAIVFDRIITQRLVDLAAKQGVKTLVGLKIGNVNKTPENIEIITKNK